MTQPRRLALLAYLVLAQPHGLHPRDTLMTLLWPESTTDQGRQALRNSLHELRKALGDDVIVTAGHDLVGVDPARVECDVHHLEADLAAGRVNQALERYADLLSGFHVTQAPEFERWLDLARVGLRGRVIDAALGAAAKCQAAGDLAAALSHVRGAQALDADDERVLRRFLECSAASGDLTGALRSYRAFTTRLAREYDASPAGETTALMTRLTTRFAAHEDAMARTSIAVLPIVDSSAARDAGDLCQALGDGVIQRLSRVVGVRVCARGAVSPYRGGEVSVLAAGRDLGAEIVVDGVLTTPAGTNDIEVRIEVIRVRDGALLREATLRVDRRNLLLLESSLTAAIAPTIDAPPAEVAEDLTPQATRNGEAYILYVRGTYLFLRAAHVGGRPEDLHQCREFFERALALDPEFGQAYAGLANYFAASAARNLLRPFSEHFAHAIALCHRALAIDPTLAIPHVHFGVQAMYLESDWDMAGQEFNRAVALDPHYAEARRFLGIHLGAIGDRAGSIRELREAVRVEPHMPIYRNSLADALLAVGEYEQAIAELHVALQLDGGYRAARIRLVRCFERTEQFAEAIAQRRAADGPEQAERFSQGFARDGALGYRREREAELRGFVTGAAERANAATTANAGDLFNPPELLLALAHAELGEWDHARAWEERACATQPGRRQWFVGRPELAQLRR